jgi:4-amino-4-deoxy-L-arabinose transferase-like glycosyltransferase
MNISAAWRLRSKIKTALSLTVVSSGVFVLFVLVRVLAWQNTVLLEDSDSVRYLYNIKAFLSFELERINALNADTTPFYPIVGALFSLPGWSVETGARLASFVFSCVLFAALVGIGRQLAGIAAIGVGLLLVAFNPHLISLSFAVLTEPSYVATLYVGLWLFWRQFREPKLWGAALLGIIFALAFLNRLEGLVYLAFIPLMQGLYLLWHRRGTLAFKPFIKWSLAFSLAFVLVATPQVWWVSAKMGGFALNGRQVWSLLLQYPDDRSEQAKISGLDYSPSQRNVRYLQENPEALRQLVAELPAQQFTSYVITFVLNLDELLRMRLGELFGALVIVFFGFGLLSLYQRRHRYEIVVILGFIGFGLAGPLLHNVVIRHILAIAPIVLLVAGIGVVHLRGLLLERRKATYPRAHLLAATLCLVAVASWAVPLRSTFYPPTHNAEYSPAELEAPVAIVRRITAEELARPPVIAGRRNYLAYYAGGDDLRLPYVEYDRLLTYLQLNEVDFLYLQYGPARDFPFMASFEAGETDGLELLYQGRDAHGHTVELYRVLR